MKIAAIDIGSNAIRLLICRFFPADNKGDEFKKVEFIRIPLRLGDDVFTTGEIGEERKELFLMSMNAFQLIMEIHKVKEYRACATSAMREASNAAEILREAHKLTGLNIEVISGEEESRLITKSVMQNLPAEGKYLNIDVGGGSTEITLIQDRKITDTASFPIGTVRLLDRKVSKKTWADVSDWVKAVTRKTKNIRAIGTGGNINKLYRMGGGDGDDYMKLDELKKLYDLISTMNIEERMYKLQLNPDRADVIEHAAKIYLQVMKWGGVKEIIAPQAGLKEGLILDTWENLWKEE